MSQHHVARIEQREIRDAPRPEKTLPEFRYALFGLRSQRNWIFKEKRVHKSNNMRDTGTGIPKQTIESAVRSDTGEVLLASDLLAMSEKAFTELRRATWPPTKRPDNPGPPLTFRCTLCDALLSLSRIRKDGETKNRFYIHRRPTDTNCPWLHRNRLSEAQVRAMQYFGQHEGEKHRKLKNEIADVLRRDPEADVESVIVDRFQLGKVLFGERKRPDVRATWRTMPLVFEIQLSYTFISEAVKRDYFYKNEGCFLIWIFAEWMPNRATFLDEEAHNRRNAFVFDSESKAASEASGQLMLRCYCTVPVLNEELREIDEVVEVYLVALSDLTFPEESKRPYFKDCDILFEKAEEWLLALRESDQLEEQGKARPQAEEVAERKRQLDVLERAQAEVLAEQRRAAAEARRLNQEAERNRKSTWETVRDELIALGRDAFRTDGHEDKSALASAIAKLPDKQHREDAGRLIDYPYLQTALKLIGIQTNTPLGTKFKTVFEVLASSLQVAPGQQNIQKRMAQLYFAAVHAYKPPMQTNHRQKIREREATHREEEARDPDLYATDPAFLRTIRLLLPEIAAQLDQWDDEQMHRGSPGLVWSEAPDKDKASAVGKRYLSNHPETDWRRIYADAGAAKRLEATVPEFIERCAAKNATHPSDIRNFLLATTLARSRTG